MEFDFMGDVELISCGLRFPLGNLNSFNVDVGFPLELKHIWLVAQYINLLIKHATNLNLLLALIELKVVKCYETPL